MVDTTSTQYKIYLTPRISEFIYGDEIQISAEILFNGIKTMKKSIDSTDYELGVFTYGDIALKVVNLKGKYNDEFDSRSIFKFSRDLAKIRVVYSDNDGDITRFNGLISDDATKQNFNSDEITFRVLSNDSVIRTSSVAGGLIGNNVLASIAIGLILNQTKIISVLNFSASNINVDQDFTIDDGSQLESINAKKALDQILFAANSVLIIDSSNNMIVKSRDENTKSVLNLYGPFDEKNRQNIHNVKKYNTGVHRAFTAVRIGDTEESDLVTTYGYRQYKRELLFITNANTKITLARKILNEFKVPQIELEVEVPTYVAKNAQLLDPVSLNYPLRVKRIAGKFLPVVGATKIGDTKMPLPDTFGSASISPTIAFKIIEIAEKPTSFDSILKLRQYGHFTDPASCFIGFAKIGDATICGTGDSCDKFNPATIGGAKIGCTRTA